MTYKKKYPSDFSEKKNISAEIIKKSENNRLECAVAFKLAEKLECKKIEIGHHADYLDVRLSKCQIGLFGHSGGKKLVKKLDVIDPEIEKMVERDLEDGIITCEGIFNIAREMNVSNVEVGNVCQTKGIKIKKCRLGAF